VAKRIRLRMLEFAKRIGAVRGDGQADWYYVAETLAAMLMPELLEEDEVMTRGAGRPRNEDDFLAMEVHRVMWVFDVGVEKACDHISAGTPAPLLTAPWTLAQDGTPERVSPEKRWAAGGSPWQGIKAGTLAQRYWRWRKAEKERQEKSTIEIP
jgi:hypothetical protein